MGGIRIIATISSGALHLITYVFLKALTVFHRPRGAALADLISGGFFRKSSKADLGNI